MQSKIIQFGTTVTRVELSKILGDLKSFKKEIVEAGEPTMLDRINLVASQYYASTLQNKSVKASRTMFRRTSRDSPENTLLRELQTIWIECLAGSNIPQHRGMWRANTGDMRYFVSMCCEKIGAELKGMDAYKRFYSRLKRNDRPKPLRGRKRMTIY